MTDINVIIQENPILVTVSQEGIQGPVGAVGPSGSSVGPSGSAGESFPDIYDISGSVGFANNNPQYTLDTSGSGNFSSGVYSSGNLVLTDVDLSGIDNVISSLSLEVVTLFGSLNSATGSYVTTGDTGSFYPYSNPLNFITGLDLSSYITSGQTGLFYPATNPSGFITGVNLASYVQTGQTGIFVTSSQTGLFYPASNPNGYITGVNLTSYVQTGATGSFVTTGQTGVFLASGSLAPYATTASLTAYVQTSQTGAFITSGQTGAFYPASNPSGFVTGVNTGGFITTGQTGAFYPTSNPSGYITNSSLAPYATTASLTAYVQTGATGAFITSGQTGAFYPRFSNPSGYITGIDTSSFITNSQTGAFYPNLGNPSGFVLSSQTGIFQSILNYIPLNKAGDSSTGNFIFTGIHSLINTGNNGTGRFDILLVGNSTLATTGIANQYSPAINFSGNTWIGTGGSLTGSQPMNWRIYESVSSGLVPTSQLNFDSSVTGGSYVNQFYVDNSGNLFTSGAIQFSQDKHGFSTQGTHEVALSLNGANSYNFGSVGNPFNMNANAIGIGSIFTANTAITLTYDANNIFALRQGINPQTSRLYSSYTNSTTGSWLELQAATGANLITTVASGTGALAILAPLQLGVNRTPYIHIATGGNVGINNTNPQYNLDISGSGNFTSGLYVSGISVVTNSFYRAGTVGIGSNSTSQVVAFSSNFANTGYAISLTPDSTLVSSNSLSATSKTVSGFTITLTAGVVGGFNVDYHAVIYN